MRAVFHIQVLDLPVLFDVLSQIIGTTPEFQCHLCGQITRYKRSLTRHLVYKHPGTVNVLLAFRLSIYTVQ